MFDPSERIKKAIYYFVEKSTQQKSIVTQLPEKDLTSEFIAQNVFNWKHADGRIHATPDGGAYTAVSASIYHEKFRTQIEDGVWPIVEALTNKNYLPVSSCEGHRYTRLFVSVAFGSPESANTFYNLLNNSIRLPTFFVRKRNTLSNQKSKVVDGKLETIKTTVFDTQKEAQHLNKLFMRNYEKYYFVEFGLFEFIDNTYIYNYYMNLMKFIFRKFAERRLTQFFQSNKLPSALDI